MYESDVGKQLQKWLTVIKPSPCTVLYTKHFTVSLQPYEMIMGEGAVLPPFLQRRKESVGR